MSPSVAGPNGAAPEANTAPSRTAWVAAERLPGWLDRFRSSHGEFSVQPLDQELLLQAEDGSSATIAAPWPVDGRPGRGADPLERLISMTSQARTVLLLLIRRGGYAVAVTRGGEVLHAKVGTRYVQSRTAAGGWSQQRFARRRANQADAMIEAVAAHAAALPLESAEYLVLGGDKKMAAALIAEPVLSPLAKLKRLAFLDVPDPRAKVLEQAAKRVCSAFIRVTDA
ncbi:acVLRF1 family peptidyl-tRNA hydrolase [Psychromicrobium lacuslunae]|uniref:Actinobacteria/chloroflexi VLRF1 release factor domain-containing protein n=1 Tax=Psychromicrobium lacuslunae TaxID=1618207 RepID=A0A0D4BWX9_9MICC|nr:acVLRF1 family peptidyl-tRNA hydrolase [Psychromicrobium lacuslunae]AJT40972.1 hypothetical protein UM93_04610 [Psychromicrobium lacuslunae]